MYIGIYQLTDNEKQIDDVALFDTIKKVAGDQLFRSEGSIKSLNCSLFAEKFSCHIHADEIITPIRKHLSEPSLIIVDNKWSFTAMIADRNSHYQGICIFYRGDRISLLKMLQEPTDHNFAMRGSDIIVYGDDKTLMHRSAVDFPDIEDGYLYPYIDGLIPYIVEVEGSITYDQYFKKALVRRHYVGVGDVAASFFSSTYDEAADDKQILFQCAQEHILTHRW